LSLSRNEANFLPSDSCFRNATLEKMGLKAPTHVKTGTTIAGIIFKVLLLDSFSIHLLKFLLQDGVVLGADTRATSVCHLSLDTFVFHFFLSTESRR
jgi:hypothetical protein